MKSSKALTWLVASATVLTAPGPGTLGAAEEIDVTKLPPPADRKEVTYEKDIRPIFEKHCFKCHGEEKPKAGLRLDSREAALKGSREGKVIRVGESARSPLVHSVARLGDEDHWMPPPGKGEPLTPEQIGLIRAWIDQGAR
ncbi:hypothetical protein G4L39_13665 [Limisphaera ngatamarikiensis]|uniref:Cytochrome C Planctomycete-type domain-containing protein n=1 Tax=Limisphaera ngatamarikiensis TaxID=1324935 RepID=A0A6M1S592_9BACT|nr:c-type cytochrome domain-containing protein [Limisphaera ngatamarikiensis]NGO40430.1 hypothetical protein [Limisphaera ngatamarikiensis]